MTNENAYLRLQLPFIIVGLLRLEVNLHTYGQFTRRFTTGRLLAEQLSSHLEFV